MTTRISGWALALALVIPATAAAGIDNAGTTAANFLSVGSGAGIQGMGGATLGSGADLNAASWNAAALGWLRETEMVFSHANVDAEQSQEWIGLGGLWQATKLHWAVTGLYHGAGSFEGRDATGVSTGTFDAASTALGVQLARRFGENVSAGFGAKYVTEDLAAVRGSGVTFEGGVMARAGRFGFGVAAQNLGGQMRYDNMVYRFPANVGGGVSVDVPEAGLRFAVDANAPYAYYSDVRAGVEWRFRDQFALRTGYRASLGADSSEPLAGPAFGLGAGFGGFWFDYGYQISGPDDGGQHRVGITLRPSSFSMGSFGGNTVPDAEPKPVSKPEKVAPEKAEKAPAPKKAPAPAKAAPKKLDDAPAPKVEKPAAVAPKKIEPAKSEAVKTAPAQVAPEKAAPAKAEPQQVEPEKAEPAPKKVAPAKPAPKPAPAEEAVEIPETHKVKSGDTLTKLARLYQTSVPKIMMLNNMVNETIHVGQVLKIPQPE